jgi:hypothetical protein
LKDIKIQQNNSRQEAGTGKEEDGREWKEKERRN